jgi:hypothetical protein
LGKQDWEKPAKLWGKSRVHSRLELLVIWVVALVFLGVSPPVAPKEHWQGMLPTVMQQPGPLSVPGLAQPHRSWVGRLSDSLVSLTKRLQVQGSKLLSRLPQGLPAPNQE